MLWTESLIRVGLSVSPTGAVASACGAQRIERGEEARVLALRSDGHAQKAGAPKRAAAEYGVECRRSYAAEQLIEHASPLLAIALVE